MHIFFFDIYIHPLMNIYSYIQIDRQTHTLLSLIHTQKEREREVFLTQRLLSNTSNRNAYFFSLLHKTKQITQRIAFSNANDKINIQKPILAYQNGQVVNLWHRKIIRLDTILTKWSKKSFTIFDSIIRSTLPKRKKDYKFIINVEKKHFLFWTGQNMDEVPVTYKFF